MLGIRLAASLVKSALSGRKAGSDINLDALSPKDRANLEVQMKLQEQQEVVTFITNLLKKKHETTMSIINNIK